MEDYSVISSSAAWASYVLDSQTHTGCFKQFMEAKQNKLSELSDSIIDMAMSDIDLSTVNGAIVAAGDTMYNTRDIALAIREDYDTVHNITGDVEKSVDDILEEIGSALTSATINTTFVDALATTIDPAGAISVFSNMLQARIGELTTQCSGYADMCMTILSSPASSVSKLHSFFSSMLPSVNEPQTGFTSVTWECTGVNPAALFMDDIDLTNVGTAIVSGVKKAGSVIKNMFTGLFNGAKKLCSKVVDIVEQSTSDPIDVKFNDTYQDFSFNEGFISVPFHDQYSYLASLPDFQAREGEYFMIPLLGGTVYVPSSVDYSETVPKCAILKPHLYSYTTAVGIIQQLTPCLNNVYAGGYTTQEDIVAALSKVSPSIAASASDVHPFKINESAEEPDLFAAFLLSKAIFAVSLGLLKPNDYWNADTIHELDEYASILGQLQYAIEMKDADIYLPYGSGEEDYQSNPFYGILYQILGVNQAAVRAYASGTITNRHWLEQVAIEHQNAIAIAAPLEALFSAITNFVTPALVIPSDSVFIPYQWVTGQLDGRYTIKSDAENANAFGNLLKTVAIIVGIVVLAVVGIKIRCNMKTKALRATAAYQRELKKFPLDWKKTYKLQKKAQRLNKVAGTHFVDTAGIVSNFANVSLGEDQEAKFTTTASNLANNFNAITGTSDKVGEIIDLIK